MHHVALCEVSIEPAGLLRIANATGSMMRAAAAVGRLRAETLRLARECATSGVGSTNQEPIQGQNVTIFNLRGFAMSFSWPAISFWALVVSMALLGGRAAADEPASADARAKRFIEQYEATVRPLEIEMNRATWNADITGKEEAFQKKQAAEEKLGLCLGDPQRFAELKAIREARPTDPDLGPRNRGPLPLLLPGKAGAAGIAQADAGPLECGGAGVQRLPRERRRQGAHGQRRPPHPARPRTTRPSAGRPGRRAKVVGRKVLADLKATVALRNESARKLGFADFFALRLYCNEQNQSNCSSCSTNWTP